MWKAKFLGMQVSDPAFPRGGRVRLRAARRCRELFATADNLLDRCYLVGRGGVFTRRAAPRHASVGVRWGGCEVMRPDGAPALASTCGEVSRLARSLRPSV